MSRYRDRNMAYMKKADIKMGLKKGEDYLYLVLHAPGHTEKFNEPVRGKTWLQKIMYVVSKIVPNTGYWFTSDKYGHYCKHLEDLCTDNTNSGIIKILEDNSLHLSTTKYGIAEKLWEAHEKDTLNYISSTKSFLNELNRQELIAYMYSTYPEMTSKSEIMSEFEEQRLENAIGMFKRDKISLAKATQISGRNRDEFESILQERNIAPYKPDLNTYNKSLKIIDDIT